MIYECLRILPLMFCIAEGRACFVARHAFEMIEVGVIDEECRLAQIECALITKLMKHKRWRVLKPFKSDYFLWQNGLTFAIDHVALHANQHCFCTLSYSFF